MDGVAHGAFAVRATAGTLRGSEGIFLHHAWTEEGVVAGPASNGAQLLHLSVALCVLNDVFREAERLGIEVAGVSVLADGTFDGQWRSNGIAYSVTIDSPASDEDRARLLEAVDAAAEIPRAIRSGAPVVRVSAT